MPSTCPETMSNFSNVCLLTRAQLLAKGALFHIACWCGCVSLLVSCEPVVCYVEEAFEVTACSMIRFVDNMSPHVRVPLPTIKYPTIKPVGFPAVALLFFESSNYYRNESSPSNFVSSF